jgi:enamine deaminase RidA (YjgF/YER057c/UK114 family)
MSSIVATMPHNRIVNPPDLPKPAGYSHAVVAGQTVYLAGQIGEGATLAEQFDGALANLVTALRAAGGEPQDLVSLQIFVTDTEAYRSSLRDLGEVWRRHYGRHYPAMALLGVTGLAVPEAMVEVMGIAVLAS